MKKQLLIFTALCGILTPLISSCGEDYEILRIYNCEDYIYEGEDDTDPSMTELFEQYMLSKGKKVRVIYDTYDTNEGMLSQVKTGKVKYDLICASDYAIQKMIAEKLVVKFEENGKSTTPIYDAHVSPFIIEKLDTIYVKSPNSNEKDRGCVVNDYARGYMWGTLGILYNADVLDAKVEEDPNFLTDVKWGENYSFLWNEKFKNEISIKDSVRDTYAIGVFKAYEGFFENEYDKYHPTTGETPNPEEIKNYNKTITEKFNSSDDTTRNDVLEVLKKLKDNIFGFEVDSGKNDIQKGTISINTAWSGDAAYAISMSEEEGGNTLRYMLPKIGANIWFDGWVMPNGANVDLASEFVDFISDPNQAVMNMDYTGYTPVIAGNTKVDEEGKYPDPSTNTPEAPPYTNDFGTLIFDYVVENYGISKADHEALTDEEKKGYYEKNVTYFFKQPHDASDAEYIFYVPVSDRNSIVDSSFPDEEVLPTLCIMDDFGPNTAKVLQLWEKLKNNTMDAWVYYVILCGFVTLVALIVTYVIIKKKKTADRILRLKEKRAK